MSNGVTQEKLERGFSFYLNNNRSRKGEGMGGERKGKGERVQGLEQCHAGEHSNFRV
jgi:hypothetical protein